MICGFFFFFRQKTSYELRISDWSSYVCSSDLRDAEGAMAAARAAETALTSGAELDPLHGVTATVKDLADVAGLPTERGSHNSKGNIATVATPLATRLRSEERRVGERVHQDV